jgi:hypothetical protein
MKKLFILTIAAAMMMLMSSFAAAQTANGTLTVTATVNGSISLVFNSDSSGVALSSGAGTNAATLPFGSVSAFGALAANITRTVVAGTSFTVSTPVDVVVSAANSSSANYTLKANLSSLDSTNTWTVNGSPNINTVQTITATGTYGSNAAETIAITVPFTEASGTSINNSIAFTATAN